MVLDQILVLVIEIQKSWVGMALRLTLVTMDG